VAIWKPVKTLSSKMRAEREGKDAWADVEVPLTEAGVDTPVDEAWSVK
jgi:hypothetical protein